MQTNYESSLRGNIEKAFLKLRTNSRQFAGALILISNLVIPNHLITDQKCILPGSKISLNNQGKQILIPKYIRNSGYKVDLFASLNKTVPVSSSQFMIKYIDGSSSVISATTINGTNTIIFATAHITQTAAIFPSVISNGATCMLDTVGLAVQARYGYIFPVVLNGSILQN